MTTKTTNLKLRSGVKAGPYSCNHNQKGLKLRTGVKAGPYSCNHNQAF